MVKDKYNINGRTLTLLKSKQISPKKIKAIYSISGNKGYEVQIIRYQYSSYVDKWVWRNPANYDFGYYGWHCYNLDRAEKRYDDIS